MSAAAWSVALLGMEGRLVEVEAAIGGGLPRTVLVGLPDAALYEARDRCRAAMNGAGIGWPNQLVTINLTPASLPKSGSHYDLAIVAAVMAASGLVPQNVLSRTILFGELGLDGRTRPVRGVLPALLAGQRKGFEAAIVPASQVAEAKLVPGISVTGVESLAELIEVLHGRPVLGTKTIPKASAKPARHTKDLAEVVGQE